MNLREAIEKIDRSDGNTAWPDVEEFSREFGIHLLPGNAEFDQHIKAYWLFTWLCTDTWVGYRVYFFGDRPVAVSWQPARKASETFEWLSQGAYAQVRAFLYELLAAQESRDPRIVNLDEVLPEPGFTVTYGSQLLTMQGKLADGTPVTVVRQYGLWYEEPVENWQTVDISLPDGTVRPKVRLTDVYFPYRIKE